MSDNPRFYTKDKVVEVAAGLVTVAKDSEGTVTSRVVNEDNPNVSTLFSSENTSLNLNNVRVAADDSTTAKSYIDTKLGDVETALAAL